MYISSRLKSAFDSDLLLRALLLVLDSCLDYRKGFDFVVSFLTLDKLCLSSFVKFKLYVLIVVTYILGFSPVHCEMTVSIHSSIGRFRPSDFRFCCRRVISSFM